MYQETKDSLFTAPQLRWGVIGCGVIANQMAEALAAEGRHIDGVANRTHEKAVAFADKHGVARVYDTIDDLIAAPDIDVLYLTTPHNTHITYLRKVLAAGKHVLCEKSITLNSAELAEARELASAHGVQLMDACTILHMPLYKELQRRIDAGDFGRVNLIQENFGSYKEYDMKNRFFNPELAGGALLDIGVYSLTLARLFLKSQPHEALSMMNPAPTGTDETEGILLRNAEGQMVVLSLTMHSKQPKRAMISADKAYLWTETGVREELRVGNTAQALSYVLADMERAVAGDEYARAQLGTSADVMELMTNLRADWNFKYPEEL